MAGQMCNYTQLGGQVGLDGKTAARYVGVFEQMYLLKHIDVWARNRLNRIIKTSKLQAKQRDNHFVLKKNGKNGTLTLFWVNGSKPTSQ